MSHSAQINRSNPGCLVFLIDRSGSMAEPMGGEAAGKTKAQSAADAINRLLKDLVTKCTKQEGIRDYFDVAIIGYGNNRVEPALAGSSAGSELVKISYVGNNPLRVEERKQRFPDGAGGCFEQTFKLPVWFEPLANGNTPMCEALNLAQRIIANWAPQHSASFPPIVVNISDGQATDGDPSPVAETLRHVETKDGNALLYNCHISSLAGASIEFPSSESSLPDDHARLLFRMSSELPGQMMQYATQLSLNVSSGARGFIFNADSVAMITLLDVGTKVIPDAPSTPSDH